MKNFNIHILSAIYDLVLYLCVFSVNTFGINLVYFRLSSDSKHKFTNKINKHTLSDRESTKTLKLKKENL